MQSIAALLCLTLVVIVLAVVLIFVLLRGKRDAQPAEKQPAKRIHVRSRAWLGYAAIALVLAIWSVVAALFFLVIVWLMRQNPAPDSSPTVGDKEKSTARRVYTWLFFSPIVTVPMFLIVVISAYSGGSTANQHVLSALVPLIFQLPLLAGLTSKSTFVYRHTQQGILLVALRAGMAALALDIGNYPEDGLWLFLLGNGSLWLFGSLWGWTEIKRGACWWMARKGESVSIGETQQRARKPQVNDSPEKIMEYSRWHMKHDQKDDARKFALQAFRNGDPEIRRQAVRILDELNEIEFF